MPVQEGRGGCKEHVNGAEVLVETMLGSGIDVCFANPGTSEMNWTQGNRTPKRGTVCTQCALLNA